MQKKTLIFSLSVLSLLVAGSVLATVTVPFLTKQQAYNKMRQVLGTSASQLDANRKTGSSGLYGLLDDGYISTTTVAESDVVSTTASGLVKITALKTILKNTGLAVPATVSQREKDGIVQAFNNWYQTYCEAVGKTEYTKSGGARALYKAQASTTERTNKTKLANCVTQKNNCTKSTGFTGELYATFCRMNYDNCVEEAKQARTSGLRDNYRDLVITPVVTNKIGSCTSSPETKW
ncbi:MAG: hypothetical protein WCK11_00905 [Candidatus Falkowbacteria bacterium]